MSYAEDELFYDDDIFYIQEELDDESVWVDRDYNVWMWSDMQESHIRAIINGLRNGKQYYGQRHKLCCAVHELNRRLVAKNQTVEP